MTLALLSLAACASTEHRVTADSSMSPLEVQVALDTPAVRPDARRASRPRRLSAGADSIAQRLTFIANNVTALTAATRGGRWLVDLGRIDGAVTTPAQRDAYREAVTALSPVRIGDTLHVHGPWGATAAPVTGFDQWSGRIVATLDLPDEANSLATAADRRARAPRGLDVPFAAVAYRFPVARASAPPAIPCIRDSLTSDLLARVDSVSDSLRTLLLADTAGAAPQYRQAPRAIASRVSGCFGRARALVLVALRSGGDLLTRERAVLVTDAGQVVPLSVSDYRFRAHTLLHVLDADGDGIDDVVARGYGRRVGSLVVLRLDPLNATLARISGGFAWEG